MNWSADEVAEVPPGVVTVTSTVPLPAGAMAVMEVAELTKGARRRGAEVTAVAPVKPVPVMVTLVPPAVGPTAGLDRRHRRSGQVGELVGRRGDARCRRVVTVTLTVPVPAGAVTVIEVAESTV